MSLRPDRCVDNSQVTLFGGAPGAVDEEIKYRNSNEGRLADEFELKSHNSRTDPYSRSFPSDIQASFEEERQVQGRTRVICEQSEASDLAIL